MAEKEATVYIIDLGRQMGEAHHGRLESDLSWAMTYVWDKITNIVALDRKTATLGVIGLRTDKTENELGSQDGFGNVSVLQPIGPLGLVALRDLVPKIVVHNTEDGDGISATVVAIQLINAYCKRLKYKRKIVYVSNGSGQLDPADLDEIIAKLREEEIELIVVGIDFDDEDYGFKEENKSPTKKANEDVLKRLAEESGGVFGTMAEAIRELNEPQLKTTRPIPSYKGLLTLGDPNNYDSAICIDVERYPRVMVRRPLTASNFVPRLNNDSNIVASHTGPRPEAVDTSSLASVHMTRAYQVSDPDAPGGKRDVDPDTLAKGYEYGRTAVHISETDHNVTKLESVAGMEIMGFVPWAKYERSMHMSVSCIIIAQRTNTKAILALSSLIHSLYDRELYAVARLTIKDGKDPFLTLLAPSIEVDYECLLDVQLPFAEDVRDYKFPPLDRVLTVTGKTIKEHRNLPSDSLIKAMSGFVDAMDLSYFSNYETSDSCEYMRIEDMFSPVLHRIDQAVRWRAVHEAEPVPPPPEILLRYSKPPQELVSKSREKLQILQEVADIKKVPPKSLARKRARNEVKPLSGLDVDALLGKKSSGKVKITKQNAIPEFKQALNNSESQSVIEDAAQQMYEIISCQIRDSFADREYQQALSNLRTLREELIEVEEPSMYNQHVRKLKSNILDGSLNGDRREMWWLMRDDRLGLISNLEAPTSTTEMEEAKTFLSSG